MLRIENVEAGYGATTVLRGVTIVVPPSSVVALLGPNGAGKTTLLRVASGLLRPTAGRLVLDGEDVTGRTPHELVDRGVAHIPEGRGIFRNLTVRENLAVQARGVPERVAIDRAVDAFPKLGQRLGQTAGTMSGGEQQMLALARAYATEPRIVLLDEVSMGLAPLVVEEIFEFLRRLTARGVSLLLVEQYVHRALAEADYAYLVDRGRVTFAGEPVELGDDDVLARYLSSA